MSLAMKARHKVRKRTVKDKVFGCDLLEHLQLTSHEVPQVLKSCADFVEEHGIVDGIYRLCGISSNVQKLRQEFDLERAPDLNKSPYLQDVHCVSSLCKAYFRELPNPLLTYQLYDKFADAVALQLEEQRLIKIRDVLKELPLPHYRTLEYLMKHLLHVASFSAQTNMHTRNLAIVWAPNLLRSRDIESSGFNGTAAFMEVRVQSIVVEFILTHVEQLFGSGSADGNMNSTTAPMNWPTCVPEDYYRSLSYNLPSMLNHGDGPPQIRPYHTIIEFSDHKRKGSLKAKKWKSIFNLGRSHNDSKRKSTKQDEKEEKSDKMNLRPAKSMDSLSSAPYTADGNDLDQRGLTRRSAKHQVALRRESLGESKKVNAGYEYSDAGEQAYVADTNDGDYEEEGQAKSEPTTPKSGRASMVTTPQGRSPKTNRNRAEKCVGVHISGPFSVTLPFHITSNLSRLTRGMECPSLSYSALHRSSERLFSQEGNLYMGSSDTDKVRLTMVSHIDQENNQPIVREDNEQKTETIRISREVQDSFSFLDSQDTNPDETKSACKSEEDPLERTSEYPADSEMLQYNPQHNIQMEEFSVEPPQDDLCTEDESDQMYFTPASCLDRHDPLQDWHNSLEDVYLSAYDDLSPLSEEFHDHHELDEGNAEHGENEQSKKHKENDKMEENISDQPPATSTHEQEEAPGVAHKLIIQPDMADGSRNSQRDDKDQYSPQCDLRNHATSESISSTEESDRGNENIEITNVHEFNTVEETAGDPNSGIVIFGDNLQDKDSEEDKAYMDVSVPLNLQCGAICRKHTTPELEAMLLHLCSSDLPVPESYDRDPQLLDDFNNEGLDSHEQQEHELFNQEMLPINDPSEINLDLSEVQDPQYHGKDDPLVHELTLKDLDSPKNDKDEILLEDMEHHSMPVQVGLECAEDMSIVEDNRTPNTIENKDKSLCCPSDTPIHENPHQTTDNTIKRNNNISLPEILSLLDCLEAAEVHPRENEAKSCNKHQSMIGNQVQDTENSQSDLHSPQEMIESSNLCSPITMIPPIEDQGPSTLHDEFQIQISQTCSFKEPKLSDSTKSTTISENIAASSINPDGSAIMKLAITPNKVQQVKSVPVVPPKPQFAKLPTALKSKLHVSSLLSTTRDIPKSPKPDKAVGSEPTQSGSDCTPKRRSSWRNATSVSFDTAMALAKERQQSQNTVRRMQTYCIGDSSYVMDSKIENSSNFPKFTIKSASSRTHRPHSCMSLSSAEADFSGSNFLQEDPKTLPLHGAHSLFQQEEEGYTKELPQRNRLSMPRIGQKSTDDVHIHQRRSLL